VAEQTDRDIAACDLREPVVRLIADVRDCCGCTNYGAKESSQELCRLLGLDWKAACDGKVRNAKA